MSETAETYAHLRVYKQKKRQANKLHGTELLKLSGLTFVSHNEGAHLVVDCLENKIDYWPSTGLWKIRGKPGESRGVKNLISHVKAKQRKLNQEETP